MSSIQNTNKYSKNNWKKDNNDKQDKYNAVWLSHSSVSDFLKCPRLYYLKNVWKNKNGRKVNIVSPHMSLGSAVHQVIEPLALLKVEDRLKKFSPTPTLPIGEGEVQTELSFEYEKVWLKFSGKIGGFLDKDIEKDFKKRGLSMVKNVIENPGPIQNKTVKFYTGDFIPNIYLSEKENIILCGLVDWVEYIERDDTLRVIDFKTGRNEEKEDSYQLPIYKILVESLQKRKVNSGAYWYLDRDKFPINKELLDADVEQVKSELLEIGIEIKKLKTGENIEKNFVCKYKAVGQSCFSCEEFELIQNFDRGINGDVVEEEKKGGGQKVEYLGVGEYKQDLYYVSRN